MSDVNVSIEDSLTCFGVHWNVSLDDAKHFFLSNGFVGISEIQKVQVLNGNSARWAAKNAADQAGEGHTYWWLGNYDWGLGKDSALYKFSYNGFHGYRVTDLKYDHRWAGWTPPPDDTKADS